MSSGGGRGTSQNPNEAIQAQAKWHTVTVIVCVSSGGRKEKGLRSGKISLMSGLLSKMCPKLQTPPSPAFFCISTFSWPTEGSPCVQMLDPPQNSAP